jgi:hypothetical protein
MTDFGLEHVPMYYPIPRGELIAESELTNWRQHMGEKPWVSEENEAARQTGEYDFWMVSEVALVMEAKWQHIYEIPTEPVAALVSGAAASTWINQETIAAAGDALWQMRLFNELVRQHTDLGRQHFVEIFNPALPAERREAIAIAAYRQSRDLHSGIGNVAGWYPTLKQALGANIAEIDGKLVGAARRLVRRVRFRSSSVEI